MTDRLRLRRERERVAEWAAAMREAMGDAKEKPRDRREYLREYNEQRRREER